MTVYAVMWNGSSQLDSLWLDEYNARTHAAKLNDDDPFIGYSCWEVVEWHVS